MNRVKRVETGAEPMHGNAELSLQLVEKYSRIWREILDVPQARLFA